MGSRQPSGVAARPLARPFLVAHRAGNDLAALRRAETLGVALVEADVRLFHGRCEIRHLKSVGPLPLLWDRWTLAAPWRRRLTLPELLEATGPGTELMLDLKGPRARLGRRVAEQLEPWLGERSLTVCSRSWRLLEPLAGLPVRRIHSVGSPRQLSRLLRRFHGRRLEGVSIHERLLDAGVVGRLHGVADVVITWPVNRLDRAAELLGLGVDGLITDDADALAGIAA